LTKWTVGVIRRKPVLTYAITVYLDFDGLNEMIYLFHRLYFTSLLRNTQ